MTGEHPDTACTSHLQAAFDKYSAYVEKARCICRSIVSSGLSSPGSCCKSVVLDQGAAAGTTISHGKNTGMSTGYHHAHHHHRGDRRHLYSNGASDGALKRCNIKKQTEQDGDMVAQRVSHTSHDHDQDHGHSHKHDQGDDHCSHSHDHGKGSCCGGHSSTLAQVEGFDLERAAGHELVSVAITGMDCTSCGDKMTRVLLMTEGVSQARVNFIAGRADFTVDTSITNADHTIHLAASGSGFRLTRKVGGDYFLDMCVNQETAKELSREPPNNVTDVHVLDKKTVRLVYDPAMIGARKLFDSVTNKWPMELAPPRTDPQLETARRRLWDQKIKTGLAALFAIPVVTLAWGEDLTDKTKAIVSIVLGTLVQAIAIPEFYRPALSTLFCSRVVEMDMLVVISITAAYTYSIVAFGFQTAGQPLGTSEFFETSTLLITLILLGRLIATFARVKAIAAVSVRSILPSTAVLVEKGQDREIDARLLQYGDRFRLLPHSRVPTDGTIVHGSTELDESMLTGEAMPVLKQVGDPVIAGTVSGDGTVLVQLERLPGKNTVTDIAQLVNEAANSKPQIQNLADKVAGWFVPVVSTVSLVVLGTWIAVGLKVSDYKPSEAVLEAITYFVATLAVACPCALGLAVPMVLVVAGGIAARGGVIIKSAETVERARKATDVVFDKTGTITESELAMVEEKYIAGDKDLTISLTRAMVAGGKHPVSAAISKYLLSGGEASGEVSDVHVVPGAGIEAQLGTKLIRAGHPRWTGTDSHPVIRALQEDGLTILVVTLGSDPVVAFGLRTQIRPEASRVIAELKARNINVHLVSGDQTMAVKSVAQAVGVPEGNVAAEQTPLQKRDYVASIMEDSSSYVIFCGDGINDAVAVAQANIGVQLSSSLTASNITQTAADAILLNGLEGMLFMLNISRAAYRRMVFNFVWSGIYNVLAITLSSGAWVKFRIPPAYAGLAEFVSVLPVIAASMTMFPLNLMKKTARS